MSYTFREMHTGERAHCFTGILTRRAFYLLRFGSAAGFVMTYLYIAALPIAGLLRFDITFAFILRIITYYYIFG